MADLGACSIMITLTNLGGELTVTDVGMAPGCRWVGTDPLGGVISSSGATSFGVTSDGDTAGLNVSFGGFGPGDAQLLASYAGGLGSCEGPSGAFQTSTVRETAGGAHSAYEVVVRPV